MSMKEQMKREGTYTPGAWKAYKLAQGWTNAPHGQRKPRKSRASTVTPERLAFACSRREKGGIHRKGA